MNKYRYRYEVKYIKGKERSLMLTDDNFLCFGMIIRCTYACCG